MPGTGPGNPKESDHAASHLDFQHHPADADTGFELGWDHARHGVVPPPAQLHLGNPLRQGWEAGKASFGRRTRPATRWVRQWLQLRLQAWLRGRHFEALQVTPNHLAQLAVSHCPITRQTLSDDLGEPTDATVVRVFHGAGYAAGNLALMNTRARQAKGALDWAQALAMVPQAEAAEADGGDGQRGVDGLDARAWQRLGVLMSFVTPLPHAQSALLPLSLLPPNRLRLLNPAQGLQALVTQQLATPGWSARIRAIAELLHRKSLRHDFNLFVSALLPRMLEAGQGACDLQRRHALEDAWRNTLVNKRWQRFVLQLSEAQTDSLLQRATRLELSGPQGVVMSRAQATEGWALESQGFALPTDTPTLPQPALRSRVALPAAAQALPAPLPLQAALPLAPLPH